MIDIALNLSVMVEDGAWQPKIQRLQKKIITAVENTLLSQHKLKLKYTDYELSVVLTNDTRIKKLNATHRQKDYATNVLSFPIDTTPPAPGLPVMLGDIVLAHDIITREAKSEGKPFNDHLLHLVVHGVLHICGYDHETAGQARTMERLEKIILSEMKISNPYQPKR